MIPIHSYTGRCTGLARDLRSRIVVVSSIVNDEEKLNPVNDFENNSIWALWDTGANATCISERYASSKGLVPIGMVTIKTPSGTADLPKYLMDIYVTNQVCIQGVEVCGAKLEDFDALIGMDIIGLGDFIVSNYNQVTSFTYRIPSLSHFDFTKELYLGIEDSRRIQMISENQVSKNAPCPCGSGEKFKRCCGKAIS